MARFWVTGLGLAGVCAGAALAEPVTGKAARGMLFAADGAEVEMLAQDFLSAADVAALQVVAAAQPYYGAVAVSPDEGLMVDATVAVVQLHTTAAAQVAARAACDAKRSGKTPCVVVALIRPKGWKAQPVQLSAEATAGFARDFRGAGPLALAISASSNAWGIGKGNNAAADAVSICIDSVHVSVNDCKLIVTD